MMIFNATQRNIGNTQNNIGNTSSIIDKDSLELMQKFFDEYGNNNYHDNRQILREYLINEIFNRNDSNFTSNFKAFIVNNIKDIDQLYEILNKIYISHLISKNNTKIEDTSIFKIKADYFVQLLLLYNKELKQKNNIKFNDFFDYMNIIQITNTDDAMMDLFEFYKHYFNSELYDAIINNEFDNNTKIFCCIYGMLYGNESIIEKSYKFLINDICKLSIKTSDIVDIDDCEKFDDIINFYKKNDKQNDNKSKLEKILENIDEKIIEIIPEAKSIYDFDTKNLMEDLIDLIHDEKNDEEIFTNNNKYYLDHLNDTINLDEINNNTTNLDEINKIYSLDFIPFSNRDDYADTINTIPAEEFINYNSNTDIINEKHDQKIKNELIKFKKTGKELKEEFNDIEYNDEKKIFVLISNQNDDYQEKNMSIDQYINKNKNLLNSDEKNALLELKELQSQKDSNNIEIIKKNTTWLDNDKNNK